MEKTPQEVEVAYKVARKLASSVVNRMRSSHSHYVDFDDFVQEGMVAWLEGRNMYRAMIDAFAKAAKMSKYSYGTKGMKEPRTVEITSLEEDPNLTADPQEEFVNHIDASRILERIQKIEDEQVQFAILAYAYIGMSLREIATIFGKSHEWVRTYLIEPELTKIKGEFKC